MAATLTSRIVRTERALADVNTRLDGVEAKQDETNRLIQQAIAKFSGAEQAKAPVADAPKAPKTAKVQVSTTVLNRTTLRAFKATKAGKAYATANPGVSASMIQKGEAPVPAGFHLPTGERREAIQAWKDAQSA